MFRRHHGNFRAPEINKSFHRQLNNNGGAIISEIYVSPFQPNVDIDEIVAHILSKTSIGDTRLFSVEKLVGRNERINRKTYVSFKISTFDSEVYGSILNNEIWAPNQTARPFKNIAPRVLNEKKPTDIGKNYQKNFPMREFQQRYENRSKYVPPPRFKNNHQTSYQQTNHQRQHSNRFYYNNDDQQNRYRENERRYNANEYRRDDDRRSNVGGNRRNSERQSNTGEYRRDNEHRPNRAAGSSRFLDVNDYSENHQTNPFRMNRDNYQYRSTNSVYRM